MTNPQVFGAAVSARSLAVTAQRRINCYYDFYKTEQQSPSPEVDRAAVAIFGRPGLTLFTDLGAQPIRGWRVVEPYLYVVMGNELHQISAAGVGVTLGTLLTAAGPVYMHDNGTQLMVVDNPTAYNYQIFGTSAATGQLQGTFAQILAAGFLGASHLTYINNFFVTVVPGTNPFTAQTFQISNVGDCTGWSAVAFDLADSDSDPLIAVKGYKGILWTLGTKSTETWVDVGAPIQPFNRQPTVNQGFGLAAPASIVEFGDMGLAVLAQSRGGQATPALLTTQGYIPIGTPDIVDAISKYATVTDAVGASYQVAAHRFYQLSFPTAQKTWMWDSQTQIWSELQTYPALGGPDQFLGLYSEQFNNQTLLSDYRNGKIYVLDPDVHTDNGTLIKRQLVSKHLFQADRRQVLRWLQFDMSEGAGTAAGQGKTPQAMLEISRDKGRTWGAPLLAPIGPMGEYKTRCIYRRLGRARNLTFRFTVTDPVLFVVTGEDMGLEVAG